LDKLEAAFRNIYAALDEIDTYKLKALDSMQQTVCALGKELEVANERIGRIRRDGEQPTAEERSSGELTL